MENEIRVRRFVGVIFAGAATSVGEKCSFFNDVSPARNLGQLVSIKTYSKDCFLRLGLETSSSPSFRSEKQRLERVLIEEDLRA